MIPMSILVKEAKMAVERIPLRDRIMEAAKDLFFNQGIGRVTIDAVAARAGTTKMGIYRHFASKETLVLEWLDLEIGAYRRAMQDAAERFPNQPMEQLTAWIAEIAEGLKSLSHRGCPFVNTLAELPDQNDPARLKIMEHKARQRKWLVQVCKQAGFASPEVIGAQIIFLTEGAQVTMQNGSLPSVKQHLLETVDMLLRAAPIER
jgi:AcrR family transcriptional regulator